MFRMLVLQSLYNLSDEQVEYQVRDRLSFTRFLRLGIEDGIPDGTTLWLFRETLAKAGLIEKLFERFGQHLEAKGYIARGGQMVDATIVPVPKQRNSRDENDDVKAGKTPGAWKKDPSKNRQKDKDARWTKKHGKSLSVGRDRGKAQGTRLTQSDSSACEPQSSAIEGAGERKPQKEPDSGSRRARIRCSANLPGWSDRKDDRHRAGESQNRPPEPRLQHPPSCHAGAHGYRMRE